MQSLLCDICDRPIRGEAFELQYIRGEAVQAEDGRPRIVQRSGSSLHHLCHACGTWVYQAMSHLRQNLREQGVAAL